MKKKVLAISCFGITITFNIIPILYIVMHSLKGEKLIYYVYQSQAVNVWQKIFIEPFYINLDQYYRILFRSPEFLYLFWNGIKMVVPIVIFQVILGIFAAYGFSRLKFPGSETLFFIYIVLMLMPFQVTLVPNYIILNQMNLIGNSLAIILPSIFNTFGVFFLKQFMEGIDKSFIEEARLVGAGDLQILWQIIVPMCKPIIVSTFVLLFVDYWSMVEQPIIFLTDTKNYPLSVYLSTIVNENITIAFAGSVIFMILPMLLAYYVQDDLTDNLKITNLK